MPNKPSSSSAPVASAPVAETPVVVERNRGLRSGMRIQQFQDWQLAQQAERKLSDLELLAEMAAEFPLADGHVFGRRGEPMEMRLKIERAIRRLYNEGRHSPYFPKPVAPVPEYRDGKPVAGRPVAAR